MKHLATGMVLACALLAATVQAQQSVSFEPGEGYAPGALIGQQGWSVVTGTSAASFTIVNDVVSPMGGSTQAIRAKGSTAGTRVAQNLAATVSSGLWRVGHDFRYTGQINGSTAGLFMSTLFYDGTSTNQIFQPYAQDGDGGGAGGAALNGFTCLSPFAAYGGTNLVPTFTFAYDKWYRIEYLMDFDRHLIMDFRIYDISTGSKVLAASQTSTRYYFNGVNPNYFGNLGRWGLRYEPSGPDDAYYIDNFSITSEPLPAPQVKPVLPNPETFYTGFYGNKPYSRFLALVDATVYPDWSMLAGPAGTTVSTSGVVGGWTPLVTDTGPFAMQAQAANGAGSDSESWQVNVAQYGNLVDLPMDQQVDIGLGNAIYAINNVPPNFISFEPAGGSEPEGWARINIKQGNAYYYGPHVDIVKAIGRPIDITECQTALTADMRYFQTGTNPYGDAPIFLRLYTYDDANVNVLGYRDYSIIYATQAPFSDLPYPAWTTRTVKLNDVASKSFTDTTFNPAKVHRLRFYGTDWQGSGDDFVDIKNLVISNVLSTPAIVDVQPIQTAYAEVAYQQQMVMSPCQPATWSLVSNAPGAAIGASGLISGWTPTVANIGQTFNFSATATNAAGSDVVNWQVLVKEPPIADSGVAAPWGTVHADIFGSQSSNHPSMLMKDDWGLGATVDWSVSVTSLDPLASRANHRASMTFDEVGNLYWRTIGATDSYLVSVTPTGTLRWLANINGTSVSLGRTDTASPVVGDQGDDGRVYVLTSTGIAAFAKMNGDQVWSTTLAGCGFDATSTRLTPAMYNGKLYVSGAGAAARWFYQVNSLSGAVEWSTQVSGFTNFNTGGQMTLVPDALGAGIHGLYMNCDGGSSTANSMYCVALNTGTSAASLSWAKPGGKVARAHVIYLPAVDRVCTHTWNDYGSAFYTWSLDGSRPASTSNPSNGAHGYEDFGAADFDGNDVIAGAFDGRIARYMDIATPGDMVEPTVVAYTANGFEGFTLGAVTGQGGWDTYGPFGPVMIVDDPTGGAHGKVMMLDPAGISGGVMGTDLVLNGLDKLVVLEWDQWRADNSDNLWIADNRAYDGWYGLGWDSTGQLSAQGFNAGATMVPGQWQHVKYVFNLSSGAITVSVDASVATGSTGDTTFNGIDFEIEPTAAGTPAEGGPMYIDNVVLKHGPAPTPPPFAGSGWYQMNPDFFENRGVGGLYQTESGKSIYVNGTSSNVETTRVVGFNVTDSTMLTAAPPQDEQPRFFEFNTTVNFDPRGGPLLGPVVAGQKQHIYLFTSDSQLIALTHLPRIPGDFDFDRDVDGDDLSLFMDCAAGGGIEVVDPTCVDEDMNGDSTVDMVDFAAWQRCYSGQGNEGDADCYP